MANERENLRIEIDTPVRELAEGSLLLELSGLLGVLQCKRSVFRSPHFPHSHSEGVQFCVCVCGRCRREGTNSIMAAVRWQVHDDMCLASSLS